ncbi:MAG: hypothetical protein ACTSXX_01885 [Candidatus Baldrarchaeia archaeon]
MSAASPGAYDGIVELIVKEYYGRVVERIGRFLFVDGRLVRLLSFHRLVRRESAQKMYVRRRVFDKMLCYIKSLGELAEAMVKLKSFDLNISCCAYWDPSLASEIKRARCHWVERGKDFEKHWYFDCPICGNDACKRNVISRESFVFVDVDFEDIGHLEKLYPKIVERLRSLNICVWFKLSSDRGLHILVPLKSVKNLPERISPYERALLQVAIGSEIRDALHAELGERIRVDTSHFLDYNASFRVPFALHYKLLLPSLPLDDENWTTAFSKIKKIRAPPEKIISDPEVHISSIADIADSWEYQWEITDSTEAVGDLLHKYRDAARRMLIRESITYRRPKHPPEIIELLRRGPTLTQEEISLLREYFRSIGYDQKRIDRIIKKIAKK